MSVARRLLERRLDDWGCPVREEAALVAQELIANAVRHGCSHPGQMVVLTLELAGGEVSIAVEDPSVERPRLCRADDEATGGRGLLMVQALTSRWGSHPAERGRGKRVWCVLAVPVDESGNTVAPPRPSSGGGRTP